MHLASVLLGNEADASLDKHLKLARKFLSSGQLADALTHYHAALDLDANNYMSLFGRATVYQAMGKPNAALSDLDKILQLKPDFSAARMQRAELLLKKGHFDRSEQEFNELVSKGLHTQEVKEKLATLRSLRRSAAEADAFARKGDYLSAIKLHSEVLEVCVWGAEIRMKRANCFEKIGDISRAVTDIRSAVKFLDDSCKVLLKLSNLYYSLGEVEEALSQTRECLKLDPDHKSCHSLYKKVKQIARISKDIQTDINDKRWTNCADKAKKLLQMETNVLAVILNTKIQLCKCTSQAELTADAIRACTEVLDINPNLVDALCDRAEAYIQNSQHEDAVRDYKTALNLDRHNERVRSGLERSERLLKQSKRKDYYAILGVKRNARKSEIMKAYRKLAQKWHPDGYRDEAKKEAEAKFLDIAAAKEVLTDPDKRAQFDSGIDPLDPEAQQHHNHPFYGFQGFNPFGHDGPFTFKFHFS